MSLRSVSLSLLAMSFVLASLPAAAQGQRRPAPANTRQLDVQAEKVQTDFLKGLAELANKYEEAGEIDKAKEMLQSILKVKPDVESVKEKLKKFDEAVFKENQAEVEVDSARGWVNTGLIVTRDKPVHLESKGTYKFILNDDLGPNGFASRDTMRDLVSGVPTGGLMGMVVAAPQGGNRNRSEEPRPFFIGERQEVTPKDTGLLWLKLNVPPSSKCIGKVKVTVTGNFSRG
jgi:hypothetical protein